jgi:outer membrane protein assembly factor BamB
VTALSPGLHRTGVFAPATWADDNAHDLDLGSTQPALLPDGMLLEDGKRGTAYLVDSAHLGGVGGQVARADVCEAYGGAAVQGTIVYEPCAQGGLAAVDTTGHKIRVRWRGPSQAQGSPVIGGGAVWVTDYQGGTLYELDQATGATRDSLGLRTTLPHFSSMSMTGSHAFLGTMEGVIAVGGV